MGRFKKSTSRKNFHLLTLLPLLIIFLISKLGQTVFWSVKLVFWPVHLCKSLKVSLPQRPKKKATKSPLLAKSSQHIPLFKPALFIALLLLYSILLIRFSKNLPSPTLLTSTTRPLTTQIYDRNHQLLYQFYEGQNRKLVKFADLPDQLIYATIAIEDKHFFTHPGIDLSGIVRALKLNWENKNEESPLAGGSTITQQLIKNTLLDPEQTFSRKIKEIILALWTERLYSKKEILTMYFNEAPYGGPAWGVEAAAEMYFGKSVHDLNLAESTYLAGLPAAPTLYSPFGTNPEKGKLRQKRVLQRMVEDGYLTSVEADKAYNFPLNFSLPQTNIKAPHFVMYIRSVLAARYGARTIAQGGLKVITTLDLNIQEMAENVVAKQIDQLTHLNVTNGAAMILDAKNGQILAMVGSKNYFDPQGGNFNATLALRAPGSAIKPVTYVTAFKQGFSPGNLLLDTPTTFPNQGDENYLPANYDGKFHGPVTIRTALGSSYNVPAVKTLAMVGLPAMIQTAREMGITTFTDQSQYGLSLTLGGGAVRMIDLVGVYNTLASGGIRFTPQAILSVTDSYGHTLEDNQETEGKRVLIEEVAYLVNNILSDQKARIPAFGANSLLDIPGHPSVAVKTGTSDNKRDNWTLGFTPEYVVGVWVGNFNNSAMNQKLTSGVTGATPIWHELMVNLISTRPDLSFIKPAGIIEMVIDGHKDLTISGQVPKTLVSFQKVKQKDKDTGIEKEVTAFKDQFTTFVPEQNKTTQ